MDSINKNQPEENREDLTGKKAVERMGGTVDFESELGKGSRFWIQLSAPSRD